LLEETIQFFQSIQVQVGEGEKSSLFSQHNSLARQRMLLFSLFQILKGLFIKGLPQEPQANSRRTSKVNYNKIKKKTVNYNKIKKKTNGK
jgi:hypothetical protein